VGRWEGVSANARRVGGQNVLMLGLWTQVAQRVGGGGEAGEGDGGRGSGGGVVSMDAVQRAVLRAAGFTWCVFRRPFVASQLTRNSGLD